MNRLRKMLLFQMAQQLGRDTCYRCGDRIDTLDEFSIDHKQPWSGRNVDLFWSLDNIAFSHLVCNVERREFRSERRRRLLETPAGQAWCTRCKTHQPTENFSRNKSNPSGLMSACKACRAVEQRRYREQRRAKMR